MNFETLKRAWKDSKSINRFRLFIPTTAQKGQRKYLSFHIPDLEGNPICNLPLKKFALEEKEVWRSMSGGLGVKCSLVGIIPLCPICARSLNKSPEKNPSFVECISKK